MTNVLQVRHSINTITTKWKTTQLAISKIILSDALLCLAVTVILENLPRNNSNSHIQPRYSVYQNQTAINIFQYTVTIQLQ